MANPLDPTAAPAPAPVAAQPTYNYQPSTQSPFGLGMAATPMYNQPDANTLVQGSLEAMLNPNSQYIKDARRRGMNFAAQRGGVNSSIAAGASERAAVDAAVPLAQSALNIQQGREGAERENWLSGQNFNRALLGQFSSGAFNNSLSMLNTIQQYALEDPELYTPEVTSGFSNFFNENMNNILKQYFPKV